MYLRVCFCVACYEGISRAREFGVGWEVLVKGKGPSGLGLQGNGKFGQGGDPVWGRTTLGRLGMSRNIERRYLNTANFLFWLPVEEVELRFRTLHEVTR